MDKRTEEIRESYSHEILGITTFNAEPVRQDISYLLSRIEKLERENGALREHLTQADCLHVDTHKAWGKQVYSPNSGE